MVSLCINYRCGTSRAKAMGNVLKHNDFRGTLLNIAKKLATFLIHFFPILKHGGGELSLHNQFYTQKYLF